MRKLILQMMILVPLFFSQISCDNGKDVKQKDDDTTTETDTIVDEGSGESEEQIVCAGEIPADGEWVVTCDSGASRPTCGGTGQTWTIREVSELYSGAKLLVCVGYPIPSGWDINYYLQTACCGTDRNNTMEIEKR